MEGPLTRLFVYGTLTDPVRMRRLVGRGVDAAPATLAGHERREGRYPYLVSKDGSTVDGVLLRGLTRTELEVLDAYEVTEPARVAGALRRLYTRERRSVALYTGRSLPAYVYLPNLDDWPASWLQSTAGAPLG